MSISLNNHESRIEVLESRRPRWEPLLKGVVSIPNTNWVKVCEYDVNSYHFGMIGVDNSYNPNVGTSDNIHLKFLPLNEHNFNFVAWELDPLWSKQEIIQIRVEEGNIFARTIPDGEVDNYVVLCWGLKLYYNFSYNIYRLICAFLEFLFKEV